MTVKRIVVDIETPDVALTTAFYSDLFALDTLMDMGWVATLGGQTQAPVQVTIASDGGSGSPVPDLSIEVDDVDAVHLKAQNMGCPVEYPLTNEPWGVRRFFLRDPAGKLVNVLSHLP